MNNYVIKTITFLCLFMWIGASMAVSLLLIYAKYEQPFNAYTLLAATILTIVMVVIIPLTIATILVCILCIFDLFYMLYSGKTRQELIEEWRKVKNDSSFFR